MRTMKALRIAGVLAVAALAARCGDGNVTFEPGTVDPDAGTFQGTTSNGGVITILVGSVEAITMICSGQTFGGACSPVVEVVGGRANGVCNGLTFDLLFTGNDSVDIEEVSAGTSCDGAGSADRTASTGPTQTPGAPTPTSVAPTPTVTEGGGEVTPTATPTPGDGPACGPGDMIAVSIDLATGGVGLAGAQVVLDYPASVSLPGSIDAPSVAERVDIIPSVGFMSVNDEDTQPDGVDDRLNISVVSGTAFAEGPFADVTFDCEGTAPTAGSFTCTADGSDEFGGLVTTTCTLAVTGP